MKIKTVPSLTLHVHWSTVNTKCFHVLCMDLVIMNFVNCKCSPLWASHMVDKLICKNIGFTVLLSPHGETRFNTFNKFKVYNWNIYMTMSNVKSLILRILFFKKVPKSSSKNPYYCFCLLSTYRLMCSESTRPQQNLPKFTISNPFEMYLTLFHYPHGNLNTIYGCPQDGWGRF